MTADPFITSLLGFKPIAYIFVFVGMMFEGDAILFSAAFLTHAGFFEFPDIVSAVLGGIFLGDILWYWFGVWFNRSSSPRISKWLDRVAEPFDTHLLERPLKTIFISKFTYGLGHIILMRAGRLGVPFKKFLTDDVISIVPWILIVGGLGYLSGFSFFLIKRYFRFAEFAIASLIVFLILEKGVVTRQLKKGL